MSPTPSAEKYKKERTEKEDGFTKNFRNMIIIVTN
jgi:hypothetical protein